MTVDGSRVWHIIVAAGSGTRLGGEPKQWRMLGGKPVVVRAIESVLAAVPGSRAVAVISAAHAGRQRAVWARYGLDAVAVAPGGKERYESVRNALALIPADAQIVAVHDAARPLQAPAAICRVVEAVAAGAEGVVPVVAVADTLRRLEGDDGASRVVDRALYKAVQTPQAFPAATLREAYARPLPAVATDDASLVEAMGGAITLADGSPDGFKITGPLDMALAEAVIAERRRRARIIFLIGMPAAGKTTLGRPAAEALGRRFIDLDELIAARAGMPVADYIARHGEAPFRALEAQTLREVVKNSFDLIDSIDSIEKILISTGGGTPCFADNMALMLAEGTPVWLRADNAVICRRLREQPGVRPMAEAAVSVEGYVADTLRAREQYYKRAPLTFDANSLESAAEVALSVARFTRLIHSYL